MNNKLFIPIAIIIAGALIAGVVIYTNYSKSSNGYLSLEQASEKLMSFVNEKALQGGMTASLIDSLEENGVYKIKFDVNGEEVEWSISKDGQIIFPQLINLTELAEEGTTEAGTTIGDFIVTEDEIVMEDGKPVVYFFGSKTCPHCQWEHPIMEKVAKQFKDYISFHNNMDSDADSDVFAKYSDGGYIPATIIGGRYFRIGSGETLGEEENTKILEALVCKITNSQPAEVCSQVQELINQI